MNEVDQQLTTTKNNESTQNKTETILAKLEEAKEGDNIKI